MKRSVFIVMALISMAQPAFSITKSDREAILDLVGSVTVIRRAAKLCPQYEFSTVEVFNLEKAKEVLGEKAYNNKIDSINTAIRTALTYGLKSTFCDMAKNSDAELESALSK